jgi:hypothetical protein
MRPTEARSYIVSVPPSAVAHCVSSAPAASASSPMQSLPISTKRRAPPTPTGALSAFAHTRRVNTCITHAQKRETTARQRACAHTFKRAGGRKRERPVEGRSHGLRHLFQIFQLRVHRAVFKAAKGCQQRHPYSRAPELWHLSCPCRYMCVHMACMHVCVHARNVYVHARTSMAVYTSLSLSLSLSRARARSLYSLSLTARARERGRRAYSYLGDLRCLVMILAGLPRCNH